MQTEGSQIKMTQVEDQTVGKDGPAKLDIEIKSDWLLTCFTFVMTSPGWFLFKECIWRFQGQRLFIGSYAKGPCTPKLSGEHNILSKTFTYYENKLVAFVCTHNLIALVVCNLKSTRCRLQF